MTIQALMSRDVHSCRPDHTLDYAAASMWEHDCGSLPVVVADEAGGEPRAIGMLTDRDVCMAAMLQGRPLHELKVADAMSRDIRVVKLDDRPEDVKLLMRELKIRRVPVTDETGALVGIVSLADFARAARSQASLRADDGIAEQDVGHTLAAICEPGQGRVPPPE
jgi:CBS domain-containing protein